MLHAFEAATENLPSEHRHVEYFSADTEIATEGGFVVELARSKREFFVPIGKTILEVLREGGINVDFSCEAGICGACETKVVSGTPDHRDVVLDDAEHAKNQVMMICCSGCKSDRWILDL
jgi:ferredoxin